MATNDNLKTRIRRGEVVVALRVPIEIEQEQLETALANDRYDYLYIDGQHTAFRDDQLARFCAMAEGLGLPVQFRIPHTRNTYLIGRYLDFGPAAIMVPEVISEATVDEAIAYSYYPQMGKRSWGGAARFGVSQGLDRVDYAAWWNDEVVLAIQLESVEAIINARKLAKPGVDYVAFGPNDLLFNLEAHPEFPLQTVEGCMQHVADQLAGTGIPLGMAVTTLAEERDKYLKMGVTVFQEQVAL